MSPIDPLAARPESLTSMVYDSIRTAIIDRSIEPGSHVSEAKLAAMLGVSKTPVREALLKLEHAGLIMSDGRRGGLVPSYSPERLRAAYELREGLEAQTARLAAVRQNADEVQVLSTEVDACLAAARDGDMEKFRAHDRAFHLAVASVSGNDYLHGAVTDAYDLVWMLRLRDSPLSGDVVYTAGEHGAVLAAIVEKDQEAARELMSRHIRNVEHFVLGAMDASVDDEMPAH